MKKFLFITTLLFGANAIAQSTLIEYNYHDDTYKYFKINKKGKKTEVKKPFAYKGVPVQVVVKDMNPYQYNITYTYKSYDEAPAAGMGGMETMLGGFTSFLGGLNGLGGNISSNPVYNSLFGDGSMDDLGNDRGFGFSSGYSEEIARYNIDDKVTALVDLNENLVKQSNAVSNILNQMLMTDYTTNELIKLLYDPEMKKAEIVSRAKQYMSEIIDTNNLTITGIANEAKSKYSTVQKFMSTYNQFSSNANNLTSIIGTLQTKAVDADDKMNLEEINQTVSGRTKEVEANYELFSSVQDSLSLLAIRDKLSKAFEVYEMIENADFDHEYSLKASRDVTQLSLDFGLTEPTYDEETGEEQGGCFKSRVIEVPTSGGFKMNTSAGISMLSFMNGGNTFINSEGTIEEVKGDLVRPAVSSMLHFYRHSHRMFMLGGSVGLSIPIEGDKDLSYMMGISGIIGKKQRIIVNLGGMAGKIDKLSEGYVTGDVLPSEYSEVPTKRAFGFGVFAGVSFNISSLFGNNDDAPSSDEEAFGFGGGQRRSTAQPPHVGVPRPEVSGSERHQQIRNPYRPIYKPVPTK